MIARSLLFLGLLFLDQANALSLYKCYVISQEIVKSISEDAVMLFDQLMVSIGNNSWTIGQVTVYFG